MSDALALAHEAFAYDRWATARMLDAVAALTDEALRRDVGGSFPSVFDTVEHVLAAGWIWMARWQGAPRGRLPGGWPPATLTDIRASWAELNGEVSTFLATLTPADLGRPVDVVARTGMACTLPLGQTLRHVANHATYHRGQVIDQLRRLGAKTVSTDLFLFCCEQAPAAESRDGR